MYLEQDPTSNKMFIATFAVCGLVAAVLVAAVALFLVRKHAKSKEKIVRLSQEDPSYEACKDYQVRFLKIQLFSLLFPYVMYLSFLFINLNYLWNLVCFVMRRTCVVREWLLPKTTRRWNHCEVQPIRLPAKTLKTGLHHQGPALPLG